MNIKEGGNEKSYFLLPFRTPALSGGRVSLPVYTFVRGAATTGILHACIDTVYIIMIAVLLPGTGTMQFYVPSTSAPFIRTLFSFDALPMDHLMPARQDRPAFDE